MEKTPWTTPAAVSLTVAGSAANTDTIGPVPDAEFTNSPSLS